MVESWTSSSTIDLARCDVSGGALFGSLATSEILAGPVPQDAPAGYLIGVTRDLSTEPGAMSAYRQAAGPLAAEAGLQMVSRAEEVHLLEGEWPFEVASSSNVTPHYRRFSISGTPRDTRRPRSSGKGSWASIS